MNHLATTIAGEEVHLLAERAVYWPAESTLFVSDLHVGKVATLRALGIPLPGGSTTADLNRLSRLIASAGARHAVILGDLYHARIGRVARLTARAFARWRRRHADLQVTLVPGNHDREAGLPASDLEIEVVPRDHRIGPFVLRHEPVLDDPHDADGYILAGHLHPGAAVRGPGGERHALPCFWVRPSATILPAFGYATGVHPVEAAPSDRIFVVVDDEVVAM